ncbi:MAG: putative metal-binding motif-containing protein [Myxococcota bacterium]|jgi:hypothetical protein|nr:putative metal-binding motif-containing protein [Myxococcota bacterium]
MRSIAASFFAALLLAACGGPSSDLCGELVVDPETDSCQCPEGTERGDDVWTCVLPDGGTIRDPNAPDASSRDSGMEDAGLDLDSGMDSGVDAGMDAGEPDGGCPELVWYRDRDRDGFGVDDESVTGCAAPDGYVAEGGDCDDECTACTPFASEICDERDNDCDGTPDEGLPQVTCYRDQDGDGFGDEMITRLACGCFEGWTPRSDSFDCGDRVPEAFPGQRLAFAEPYCGANGITEVCAAPLPGTRGTNYDYDCDGVNTEATPPRDILSLGASCAYASGACRQFIAGCASSGTCRSTCGEEVEVVEGCVVQTDLRCVPVTTRVTQRCR